MRFRDLANLVLASKRMHSVLMKTLWYVAGARLGWLPTYHGAKMGLIPLMETALELGCHIDKPWQFRKTRIKHGFVVGQTALHVAVANKQLEVVEWLLAHGASVNHHYPRWLEDDLSLLLMTAQWKMVSPLTALDRGERRGYKACTSWTNEQTAALMEEWKVPTRRQYRMFRALMEAGAEPPRDGRYFRLAGDACTIVSIPTMQLMLQHGADPNSL